jgi:hypothetical protein
MVEMIVINLPRITKSESISMLVYPSVSKVIIERTVCSSLLQTWYHYRKRWTRGRQVKEELKKITEVQINIS